MPYFCFISTIDVAMKSARNYLGESYSVFGANVGEIDQRRKRLRVG